MREVVIVEAVRTPIGRRNGKLKDVHPVVLGSLVLKEIVHRAGIEPDQVDDVVFGCVTQAGEQSLNIGRNAWLTAGFPFTTPATTVDRQCGSSQQAIHFASNLIQSGVCDITIAGGVESMTRVPMGANAVSPGTPFPPELMELYDLVPQGISAELMARKYGVSRKAMDEFSVESHQRAHEATEKGYFKTQLLPVDISLDGNGHHDFFERDEGIRANASYEATSALQPAFNPEHSITAGNSSQLSAGAAAARALRPRNDVLRAWPRHRDAHRPPSRVALRGRDRFGEATHNRRRRLPQPPVPWTPILGVTKTRRLGAASSTT